MQVYLPIILYIFTGIVILVIRYINKKTKLKIDIDENNTFKFTARVISKISEVDNMAITNSAKKKLVVDWIIKEVSDQLLKCINNKYNSPQEFVQYIYRTMFKK